MNGLDTLPPGGALDAYRREEARLAAGRVRQAYLLALVLVPAFGVLDLLLFPERAPLFIALRLLTVAALSAVPWLLTRARGRPWAGGLGIAGIVLVGLLVNVMIRLTGGYASPYYAGLSLVFLVASVIGRFNLREAAIGCGTGYALYLLGIALFDDVRDPGLLANNVMFLTSTLLVSLVGAHLLERGRRRAFLARYALREANRRLREVEQLKARFFANVSHELRTPLTLLLAPAEALLTGEGGRLPAAARRLVETIHANALALLKQINDLLDLARLDAGRLSLELAPVDLEPLVGGLVRAAEPLARQRGLTLVFRAETPARSIPADGAKVEKVVLNLLSNALKFTPPGGRVEVTLRQAASGARITVSDTGIGIARKDLPRIFDRFAQLDTPLGRRHAGSGLGLALAKELVELHGGWIDVESEPGRGSRFSVTLPAPRGAPAPPRPVGPGADATAGGPPD
ncbi:MAG TPA: ATP-binding protein, partial [Thermodesulfobacteriota bacterium]|nr:ATP-binding protein [Thermodesulfobacteriota bacterium]